MPFSYNRSIWIRCEFCLFVQCASWPPNVSILIMCWSIMPRSEQLLHDIRWHHLLCFSIPNFLEAKFNLLPAMFAHVHQIYVLACVRCARSTLADRMCVCCDAIYQNAAELLLALIFRCAKFKIIACTANQKVIIYVCWLMTTTKEINNHIAFTHWAQQVRLHAHRWYTHRAHLDFAKNRKKKEI